MIRPAFELVEEEVMGLMVIKHGRGAKQLTLSAKSW